MLCVLWLCVIEVRSSELVHRAEADQFPWLVAYRTTFRSYSANIPQKCGGVLVTPSWVLTAAHCLDIEASPHKYTVFAGSELSFLVAEDRDHAQALGYQFRSVSALYRHPLFRIEPERLGYATKNALYFQYNIALLRTEQPFEHRAQPIALTAELGRDCFILGWGPHDQLLYMSVGAVPFTYCTRLRNISNSRSICVRQRDGSVPCGGDPGTPLVCVNERDQETVEVMGISSCNDEGLLCGVPSRYLLVGIFRQWIEETIAHGNDYKQRSLLNPYLARLRSLNTTGQSAIRAQPSALSLLATCFNVLSKFLQI